MAEHASKLRSKSVNRGGVISGNNVRVLDAAPYLDLPIDDVSSTAIHEIMCTTSRMYPNWRQAGPNRCCHRLRSASGNCVIIEIVE
jgi:hypothetical protein